MFGSSRRNGGPSYSQVPRYDDSDSSDDGNPEDDFVQREIRQQKVRITGTTSVPARPPGAFVP